MKKSLFITLLASLSVLAGCSDKEVANVSLGLFTFKDIKIEAFVDEKIPGVTCHVAYINSPLQLTDPSESSVSCRRTGEITSAMIDTIDKSSEGEVVFKKSQSVFFKTLRIRRIFDAEHQTVLYLSYSTKVMSGSFKHGLSSVPLWGTKAYKAEGYTTQSAPKSVAHVS